MISILTNHGKTIQHQYNFRITQGDRITIFGENNEVARLPFNALFRQGFNFGPTIQAGPFGTVTIALTSDPEDEVQNPHNDANIAWFTFYTLNPGEMKYLGGLVFTAAKLTFNSDRGRCMVCSL